MRARSEEAFTLVEILMAVTLMAIGIAATLGVFGSAGRTTVAAQRTDVATEQAQATIDRIIGTMSYDEIWLSSTPTSSTNPLNPGSRVTGTSFKVTSTLTEPFVLSGAGQSGSGINPAPTSFKAGTGQSAVSGSIYQYVTWRDEKLPGQAASDTTDTKRVTVAVTLDPSGALPARPPVWISQVIPDPEALKPGLTAPSSSGGGTSVSAQNFYLYDTRCGNTARQSQTGSHAAHQTASIGSNKSYCENASTTYQPDLMGTDKPDGDSTTPLYSYSNDLSGTYDGGVAIKRQGTSCPTSYSAPGTDTNQPNIWSIHGWSTNAFASAFELDGTVTLSLFTSALGGASGQGVVCATLLSRHVSGSTVTDTSRGSYTYSLSSWPTTVRRISFSFTIPTATVAAGDRLVLVLGVKSTSDNDLYFVYDHPSYASFLQLATTTPL